MAILAGGLIIMYNFVMSLRVSHSGMKFCIFWPKVFLLLLSFMKFIFHCDEAMFANTLFSCSFVISSGE